MKERIFLTRKLHNFALKELKKKFQVEIHTGKIPIPRCRLKSKIKQMYGLICFPYDQINKEIIQSAKNLKVISTFSVGYDHIDTKFAKEKKIRVAGQSKIDLKTFGEGKDLNYELQIDTLPEIKLKSFEKYKAIEYKIKIEDEIIDKKLEEISNQNKQF